MLTFQVLAGGWFMIFASLVILSFAGGSFTFNLYSTQIKSALHYDQTTLGLLSFAKDCGANVGVIAGLMYGVTTPQVVIITGAIMSFVGYYLTWLTVTSFVPQHNVWLMIVYMFIGTNSESFISTGVLVTAVTNFPESRGVVLGLLKGYVGLRGAIMIQIYRAVFGDGNPSSLILLLACLPTVVWLVFSKTIRDISEEAYCHRELVVFNKMLFASLLLAGSLMAMIIWQNSIHFSRIEYVFSAMVVLSLLFAPLLIVVTREELKTRSASVDREGVDVRVPELRIATEIPPPPQPQETKIETETEIDCTFFQALCSIDMLILLLATICGAGGSMTAISNFEQIGHSLHYQKQIVADYVSLVNIWIYLGRSAAGIASEYLLRKYKFPRPLLLAQVLFFSCIGYLLIALGIPNSLYAASIIIGFSSGAYSLLVFAIISEIFRFKYFSLLYNIGAAAFPVGSYIFNVLFANKLYSMEARKQLASTGFDPDLKVNELTCIGPNCFKTAFFIITAATMFGALVSLILAVRTWKFYAGDIYEMFREQVAVAVEQPIGDRVDIEDGEGGMRQKT